MTCILREVLLCSLGIESDLQWGISSKGISAIDLELVSPATGSLVEKVCEIGKIFGFLEEIAMESTNNAYKKAVSISIDNFLDSFRSIVLKADENICEGKLTSLTGLIALLEPHSFELLVLKQIISKIMVMKPLDIMNYVHNSVISSPPKASEKLFLIEEALQQVLISQLESFLFYGQAIPEIFRVSNDKIIYDSTITFIPKQLSDVLLIIMNIAHHTKDLFAKVAPPNMDTMMKWLQTVIKLSSHVLYTKVMEQWPAFYNTLSNLYLIGRSDYISILARRLLQPHITTYDLNITLNSFKKDFHASLELSSTGLFLRSRIAAPLDLIVTQDHHTVLSEFFNVFMQISSSEEALDDIWRVSKVNTVAYRLVSFCIQLIFTIKEYIIFSVISPPLAYLKQNLESISDFLQFQIQFSQFVSSLSSAFPITNHSLIDSLALIYKQISNTYDLLINKSMHKTINHEKLVEIISDLCSDFEKHILIIIDILRNKDEDTELLYEKSKIIINCINQTRLSNE